jgi:hypothetical protein
VVFQQGQDEFLGRFVVVIIVVVVIVTVMAMLAFVVARDTAKGAVSWDQQGMVVLCVLQQQLDLVVVLDELGKLGGVLAFLD